VYLLQVDMIFFHRINSPHETWPRHCRWGGQVTLDGRTGEKTNNITLKTWLQIINGQFFYSAGNVGRGDRNFRGIN
jgi:hypothetical protein